MPPLYGEGKLPILFYKNKLVTGIISINPWHQNQVPIVLCTHYYQYQSLAPESSAHCTMHPLFCMFLAHNFTWVQFFQYHTMCRLSSFGAKVWDKHALQQCDSWTASG